MGPLGLFLVAGIGRFIGAVSDAARSEGHREGHNKALKTAGTIGATVVGATALVGGTAYGVAKIIGDKGKENSALPARPKIIDEEGNSAPPAAPLT